MGEALRQALGMLLEEEQLKDPRLHTGVMLTVTGVDVSPDLKHAQVYVSAYPETAETDAVDALNAGAGVAQRYVARKLALRFTPRLRFHADPSVRRGAEMEALFRSIADEAPEGAPTEEA